jgi:hypothetical protein
MLLSHTSGFANLRFLEPDRKIRIHFQPGSRYAYSGQVLTVANGSRSDHEATVESFNANACLSTAEHDSNEHGLGRAL